MRKKSVLPKATAAEPIGRYRLRIKFSDGRSGEWDFSWLAGDKRPMTAPFKDPAFFDRVFLEMGALTWPNGYDCCPDSLYEDMVEAGALTSAKAAE
jgi:hypothetical protein